MISLTNVAFSYPGKDVISDLTLSIEAGGMVCLFGPSGCGKSTVLDLVAGLLEPNCGERHIGSSRLGYAFQQPRLLPWRSVRENLSLALSGWLSAGEADVAAATWLERFGLAEIMEKRPAELSGGMARRANLARAFAVAPEILLLDEPFAFLDAAAADGVRQAIREANDGGVTVLLVSHMREAIEPLTPHIVCIGSMPIRVQATFPARS